MSPLLAASHVSKVFAARGSRGGGRNESASELTVLDDISFGVCEEEFVSVLGPSGCGKSTLLALMAGFDVPTSGEIRLGGSPIAGPSRDRGCVFQSDALFHWLDVAQNIAYGLRVQGYPRSEQQAIVESKLELVGLARFRHAMPAELSGGMRQRVAIARALATDPKLLLLDEPFGALDVLTRKKMQGELAKIWDSTHKTVIMITHAVDEALLLSDRILVMTRSPGTIRETLDVDLARPRTPQHPRFRELEQHLTDLLMSELDNAG